jgi:hypothetical protein
VSVRSRQPFEARRYVLVRFGSLWFGPRVALPNPSRLASAKFPYWNKPRHASLSAARLDFGLCRLQAQRLFLLATSRLSNKTVDHETEQFQKVTHPQVKRPKIGRRMRDLSCSCQMVRQGSQYDAAEPTHTSLPRHEAQDRAQPVGALYCTARTKIAHPILVRCIPSKLFDRNEDLCTCPQIA